MFDLIANELTHTFFSYNSFYFYFSFFLWVIKFLILSNSRTRFSHKKLNIFFVALAIINKRVNEGFVIFHVISSYELFTLLIFIIFLQLYSFSNKQAFEWSWHVLLLWRSAFRFYKDSCYYSRVWTRFSYFTILFSHFWDASNFPLQRAILLALSFT